jgi:hypothetical protein
LAKKTGGPNDVFKLRNGYLYKFPRRKGFFSFEILNSTFDIGPSRILRQDGSDGYFEGALRRPPLERAKVYLKLSMAKKDELVC